MSRVTAKGQVTIPKAVREDLGIRPGDEVDFVKIESGTYHIRKTAPTTEAGEDPFEKHRGRADDGISRRRPSARAGSPAVTRWIKGPTRRRNPRRPL